MACIFKSTICKVTISSIFSNSLSDGSVVLLADVGCIAQPHVFVKCLMALEFVGLFEGLFDDSLED